MNKKFIINNGMFLYGIVELHRDLASDHSNGKTKGGGWWHYDAEKDIMYLYYRSMDFGLVNREDLTKAIQNTRFPLRHANTRFFHSFEVMLQYAIDDENGVFIERNVKTVEN